MAIFDIHHPWAFTFGILGNIISVFVYLAPLPTFIRIYKEKSTMGFDSLPYAVALFSATLWMYYALLKPNAMLLISINLFGCIIETIYIFFFLFYASKKTRLYTARLLGLMNVGLLALIFLLTFFIFEGPIRVQVVGWICVVVSVSVFAAPLRIVLQVVRTRSVEFMPFLLSFFLTLSAIMWFGYGLFQRDLCVALPNVVGFFLGMLQMLLYGMYRNVKAEIKEKNMEEHVINIKVVGTPEVNSFDSQRCGGNTIAAAVATSVIRQDGDEEEEEEDEEANRIVVPCAISIGPSQANLHLESPHLLVVCAA